MKDTLERTYQRFFIALETFPIAEALGDNVVVERFADLAHTLKQFGFAALRQFPETRVAFEGFAHPGNISRIAHCARLSWTTF